VIRRQELQPVEEAIELPRQGRGVERVS
jgi:hypothetical protein